MSIWTHVNATFRVDNLRLGDNWPQPNWQAIFGEELHYDWDWDNKLTDEEIESNNKKYDEFWKKYDNNPLDCVPTGSEGSLTTHIYVNPNTFAMASYVACVFGDLRDYAWGDCEKYLEPWFEQSCKRLAIRQATCEYTCYPSHIILTWDGKKVQRVEIEEEGEQ